ncbi:MAG: hypothetical protein K1X88_22905 [Nannocystaceae bacterium]|nr:hypothetical protein [Nannocystaceae bacterium]
MSEPVWFHPPLPWRVTLVALVLVAVAWLPVSVGDDVSLVQVLLAAWHEDWLQGLLTTLVIGAPHLFGLAVLYGSRRPGAWAAAAVRAWSSWLLFEAVLLALVVARSTGGGDAPRAPWVLVGFVAVLATLYIRRIASPHVPPHRRDLGFFARAGALAIFGVFAWGELQLHGGGGAGPWFHATTAAAFALAAVVPRDR